MRISATSRRRPRTGRLLAVTAGLGLALSACTIGEVEGDGNGAATAPTTDAAATSPSAEIADGDPESDGDNDNDDDDGNNAADGPDATVDQLVLNADDAPELGLAPISPDEITGGMDALSTLTNDLRVEPPECAEFNDESLLSQAEPGTMAIQAGQAHETIVSVAVTRDTSGLPQRLEQVEACPTMTVTMPFGGAAGVDPVEASSVTTNTLLDLEAPEGTEHFAAVEQDTTTDVMGTPHQSGMVMLTGTVRGIGIAVSVQAVEGPVPGAARDAAADAFAKQATKIREA